MESIRKEMSSSRESFALGGFLGLGIILSVLAGGAAPSDSRASVKKEMSATVSAPVAGAIEPGTANADRDVLDLQLD